MQTQAVLPRQLPDVSWDSRVGRFKFGDDNPAWRAARQRYDQLLLGAPPPVQYLPTRFSRRLRRLTRNLRLAAGVFLGRPA